LYPAASSLRSEAEPERGRSQQIKRRLSFLAFSLIYESLACSPAASLQPNFPPTRASGPPVLTNAHTIKYSPLRTLRPLLLTLFFSHLLHSESHNNTQNIDYPRCSKQPSHRDYPLSLSHHSVPTLQQPTQLPSTNHHPLRLSLPGNSDFKLSFTLPLQSSNRHNTFTRV
jgi:hypothetical protein